MKILVLSWRDIKHPLGGGAEQLSHEMAKRWVKMGHDVIHFSAQFPGSKSDEYIDGVNYIREGNWYNVHFKAFIRYLRGGFGKPSVIIDEVHGIPFFARLYARTPVVCHACEVAKNVWDEMYSFPFNIIGKLTEKIYLILYRNAIFTTISKSTKDDLIRNGVKEENINILPMGLTVDLPKVLPKKNDKPTIIFLGRLAKSKGIPDAITAFSLIKEKLPHAHMFVVGRGQKEYEHELRKLVSKLTLTKSVEFLGFVSDKEKFKLLSKSHIILVPSAREGWGLIVPEANIVGTPAVVYNVPGLRDVTINGVNGYILANNNSEEMAKEALEILSDKVRYKKMSSDAMKYAKSMKWENTAESSMRIIEEVGFKK